MRHRCVDSASGARHPCYVAEDYDHGEGEEKYGRLPVVHADGLIDESKTLRENNITAETLIFVKQIL